MVHCARENWFWGFKLLLLCVSILYVGDGRSCRTDSAGLSIRGCIPGSDPPEVAGVANAQTQVRALHVAIAGPPAMSLWANGSLRCWFGRRRWGRSGRLQPRPAGTRTPDGARGGGVRTCVSVSVGAALISTRQPRQCGVKRSRIQSATVAAPSMGVVKG